MDLRNLYFCKLIKSFLNVPIKQSTSKTTATQFQNQPQSAGYLIGVAGAHGGHGRPADSGETVRRGGSSDGGAACTLYPCSSAWSGESLYHLKFRSQRRFAL